MAACSLLTSLESTANQLGTYATASVSPAIDDLIVVGVYSSGTVDTAPAITESTGGATYTLVGSIDRAGVDTLYIFVADQLVSSTTARTWQLNYAADPATGCNMHVLKVTGMTRTGLAAILQSQFSRFGIGGTPNTGAFPANIQTGNPTIVFAGNGSNPAALTPPAGWTERRDLGYSTPATGLESATRDSGFTGTTITYGGTSATAGAIGAVELDTSAPSGNNWTATPADTLGLTDARAITQGKVLAESFGLTDQASLTNTRDRSQNDGLALTDATTTAQGYAKTQADGLALTDSATPTLTPGGGGGTPHTASADDTLALTDDGAIAWTADRSTADTLNLTDNATTASQATRTITDGIGLTDQAATARIINRTQADAFGLTDQATPTLTPGAGGHTRTVNDALGLTDTLTRQVALTRIQADGLALTDSLARSLAAARTIADGLGLTDQATPTHVIPGAVTPGSVTVSDVLESAVSIASAAGAAVSTQDVTGADLRVAETIP